jgi:hypothetical protein
MDARILSLHVNPAGQSPLAEALDRHGLPWQDWFLDGGAFALAAPPPEGIFFSRMSASAHTRGHRFSPELAGAVLAWLARHGRRVVNGAPVLDLEISKVRQYAALEAAGIATPRTIFVGGKDRLVEAARRHFPAGPFILKPNRGGKGLGVRLVPGVAALEAQLGRPDWEAPVDDIYLLQAYIRAPQQQITRAEFVGGRFVYAVEVDTSDGFELCPADVCAVGEAFCPAGSAAADRPKFRILDGIEPRLVERYEGFLAATGIEVAGIEFIRDPDGTVYTYDVNTNSNYNPDAERRAGRSAMDVVAGFLGAELERRYGRREAAA